MFDNFDMGMPLGEKLVFALQVSLFGILMVFLLLIILAVLIMIISRVVRLGENLAGKKGKKKSKSGNPMKREAEEKALRNKLAGKSSDGKSSGGSAFAKKPQNPALPAGLQDLMGDAGELPPNFGGGLSGLLH